jgi:hypothetical protein
MRFYESPGRGVRESLNQSIEGCVTQNSSSGVRAPNAWRVCKKRLKMLTEKHK